MLNSSSLAAISASPCLWNGYPIAPRSALDHGEHIRLAQDQVLLVPDRDLRAAVLPVQDPVALLELGLDALAILGELAGPDGDDLALLRLFLGGVGDVETAPHLLRFFEGLDDHPICERPDLRGRSRCHRVFLRVAGKYWTTLLALTRVEC